MMKREAVKVGKVPEPRVSVEATFDETVTVFFSLS